MQTDISPEFKSLRRAGEAEAILRKCVHCGFCLATCPTYQLLGDELDSPRGRIYLVKQVLEGKEATRATQLHLDRCLTCRNCETTCPSGVEYGRLLDIGREIVDHKVRRAPHQRLVRWLLRNGLTSRLFHPAVHVGRFVRPLLPSLLREKVAPHRRRAPAPGDQPGPAPGRRMLMLAGCVQPGLQPNINAATRRVLAAAGIGVEVVERAGCCGAIRAHLSDHEGALDDMRRNVDAWWPLLQGPQAAEAIVTNASGCGVMVKEYGQALAHDPAYRDKARLVSEKTRDVAEVVGTVSGTLRARMKGGAGALAVHVPCTLQHGQRQPGLVAATLRALGFEVRTAAQESHLCCGSAGTYSLLQPELATQLRDRKLTHLRSLSAPQIVSANVGCIQHLQSGTELPVRHWIEVLDEVLG